eukprot:2887024-Pleurochrysis_carterae.AAC.1
MSCSGCEHCGRRRPRGGWQRRWRRPTEIADADEQDDAQRIGAARRIAPRTGCGGGDKGRVERPRRGGRAERVVRRQPQHIDTCARTLHTARGRAAHWAAL